MNRTQEPATNTLEWPIPSRDKNWAREVALAAFASCYFESCRDIGVQYFSLDAWRELQSDWRKLLSAAGSYPIHLDRRGHLDRLDEGLFFRFLLGIRAINPLHERTIVHDPAHRRVVSTAFAGYFRDLSREPGYAKALAALRKREAAVSHMDAKWPVSAHPDRWGHEVAIAVFQSEYFRFVGNLPERQFLSPTDWGNLEDAWRTRLTAQRFLRIMPFIDGEPNGLFRSFLEGVHQVRPGLHFVMLNHHTGELGRRIGAPFLQLISTPSYERAMRQPRRSPAFHGIAGGAPRALLAPGG